VQQRGDRSVAFRDEGADTITSRKGGLTNSVVLDQAPHGCAFKVGSGWFDLWGFWCNRRGGAVEVRRGSPKSVLKQLTPEQKKELARLRLQARRKGFR